MQLALEIRKGQDMSDSTKTETEFQDQVDMFLCATFEASRCILREIGISTTKNSTEAELRKRTRSEAHLKMMAIQECVPMKGTIEITEQEYVQARMLELSSHLLATFCERVHETWKQSALERWKKFVAVDRIEAVKQETRWHNTLAGQHKKRWADVDSTIKEMKERALKALKDN